VKNTALLLWNSSPKGTTWTEPPGITGQTQTEKLLQIHWPIIFQAINIKQRMRKYSRWKERYGVYDLGSDPSAMKDSIRTTGENRMGKGIWKCFIKFFRKLKIRPPPKKIKAKKQKADRQGQKRTDTTPTCLRDQEVRLRRCPSAGLGTLFSQGGPALNAAG